MLKGIIDAEQSFSKNKNIAKGTGILVCHMKYSPRRCIKIREPYLNCPYVKLSLDTTKSRPGTPVMQRDSWFGALHLLTFSSTV